MAVTKISPRQHDDTIEAVIVAATGTINSTETIVVKSTAIPANRFEVGTSFRVTLFGTCTSTAANVSTFAIRIGTLGTTSDGLMLSAPTAVAVNSGTAIPFKVIIELTIRTIGASATCHGVLTLFNAGTTGIAAVLTQVVLPSFTSFNSTTASNIISVTYKSAATTTTCTFQDAFIEQIYK